MISNMHQQQQHQQQHMTAFVTPNTNNNFEILTLGHPKNQTNITETNCFGQYTIPLDLQPMAGHNNGFNQHTYNIIANLTNSTKDNMLFSVQKSTAVDNDGVINGSNYQTGNIEEAPTYILLQNINNYAPIEITAPLKIGTDLLVLDANGSIQTGGNGLCDTVGNGDDKNLYHTIKPEMAAADSSVDVKYKPENYAMISDNEVGSSVSGLMDDRAPDHHARRPMNAFLIFCKRHRAIVREQYPNLENRSITKILGDWWTSLEKTEKICYTNLAKQYKDAFFSANPNFKWYKLPAPPLRSTLLPTRMDIKGFKQELGGFEKAINSSHGYEGTVVKRESNGDTMHPYASKRQTNVGIFKLADETQMGGLNSLMLASSTNYAKHNNNIGEIVDQNKKDIVNHQYALHQVLDETRQYFERNISGSTDDETYSNASMHSESNLYTPDSPAGIPSHNKLNNGDYTSLSSPEKLFEFEFDVEANGKKSSRACKGKRYLEFMSVRKTGVVAKKAKIRTSSFSSSTSSPGSAGDHIIPNGLHKSNDRKMKIDYENFDHLYANQVPHRIADPYGNATITSATAIDSSKFYDANDFALEEKIKALPHRCLDKYLSRKRDTKKFKKVGVKRHITATNVSQPSTSPIKLEPPETALEAKARMMLVGSQKRKARKESITRRDVTAITVHVDTVTIKEEGQSNVSVSSNPTSLCPNSNSNSSLNSNTSDLLFLATIAEATANIDVNKVGHREESIQLDRIHNQTNPKILV